MAQSRTPSRSGYIEDPSFYLNKLRLDYASIGVPQLLVSHFMGANHFFNECFRFGYSRLIEVSGGHGAYVLHPNPGYHDPVTADVLSRLSERKSQPVHESKHPISLRFEEGYVYIACWVDELFVPPLRSLIRGLSAEPMVCLRSESKPASKEDIVSSKMAKSPRYLSCMRDLRPYDLPLLQALLTEGGQFLEERHGEAPASMFVHYPNTDYYSTLHVHIRSANHPHKLKSSRRSMFPLKDIVHHMEADGAFFTKAVLEFGFYSEQHAGFLYVQETAGDAIKKVVEKEVVDTEGNRSVVAEYEVKL